jgi:SAM-dependent methyltransferase
MNRDESDRPDISDAVRHFYDRHPYPPPVEDLDDYQKRWEDERLRRADYHLFFPARPCREELDILIAGCGTSQAAKYALRHPKAWVVGIDFSATSVDETKKLKRKYDLDNLEVRQLPVERVQDLEMQFDQIICTGMLHHLPDPDARLRALREALKPDGAMHLMVYAAYGRIGIYMIQDYCRRLDIGSSEEEITELAEALMSMPYGHPLARLLGESLDFRRKAALADALLNPQDRAYTVPQYFDLVQGAGLQFGRWLRQAPYLPYCGNLADSPHADRLTRLPPEEQYAAVELFRGTMLRHSAILHRDDAPGGSGSVQFIDESWRNYIPHRLPNTILVKEQLPPGAAAVLINQNHTYNDLYLPIDRAERRLVEAIDGVRSVQEILDRATPDEGGRAHEFFQLLWWYDQVSYELPKA